MGIIDFFFFFFVVDLIRLFQLYTFEEGTDFPHAETSDAEELAQGALQEEHGDTGEDDGDHVRHQKSSCQSINPSINPLSFVIIRVIGN